ncbi:PspC domain-containing protein [Nocardioides pacificus]
MSTQFPSSNPRPNPSADGPDQRPWAGRRLVRRSDDRMIAGVCSGVADYLGVDVTVVRLLTVLGAVLGLGSIVIAYLVAWVVLPEA